MADDSDDYGSDEFEDDFEEVDEEDEIPQPLWSTTATPNATPSSAYGGSGNSGPIQRKTMAELIAEENKQALLQRRQATRPIVAVTPSAIDASPVARSNLVPAMPAVHSPGVLPSPTSSRSQSRPTTPLLPPRQYASLPQGRSAVAIGGSNAVDRNKPRLDSRVMEEQRKRTQRILAQIQLSEEGHDIFELQPLSAVDAYIKKLRSGTIACASTQHNEDWVSKEVQTDPPIVDVAECQAPDDYFVTVTSGPSRNDDLLLSSGVGADVLNGESSSSSSLSLQKFVHAAGQLLDQLVSQSAASHENTDSAEEKRKGVEESANLRFPVFLAKHQLTAMAFSPLHCDLLAVALCPPKLSQDDRLALRSGVRPRASSQLDLTQTSNADFFDTRSVVLLWDLRLLHNPNALPHLLYCDGEISSVGVSPVSDHLVFAGLQEGSLVLWDLRDPSILHRSMTLQWWDPSSNVAIARAAAEAKASTKRSSKKSKRDSITASAAEQLGPGQARLTARHAAFTTHNNIDDNHTAPVISVQGVGKTSDRQQGFMDGLFTSPTFASVNDLTASARLREAAKSAAFEYEEQLGVSHTKEASEFDFAAAANKARDGGKQSFQVASLDAAGEVCIWTIVELHEDTATQVGGGSEHDLGLDVGSRVKLIKSASVVEASYTAGTAAEPVLCFLPHEPNDFFYTSRAPSKSARRRGGPASGSKAAIYRSRRFGDAPPVTSYGQSLDASFLDGGLASCTCISFSPFMPSLFLAGFSDGVVRLFVTNVSHALSTWVCSDSQQQRSGRWAVMNIQWSGSCSVRFCTVTADAVVHTWSLEQSEPLYSCPLRETGDSTPLEPYQKHVLPFSRPSVSEKDGQLDASALFLALPIDGGVSVSRILEDRPETTPSAEARRLAAVLGL